MENESGGKREIRVSAQYIKDLSFENPRAPGSLGPTKAAPETAVTVDINAGKLGDDLYEVELKISTRVILEAATLFLVELNYAGLFTITGIPEDELETVLVVYAPSLLFPFARRIIADTTRDGGFPPLMLDPVDFGKLYMERRAEAVSKKAKGN